MKIIEEFKNKTRLKESLSLNDLSLNLLSGYYLDNDKSLVLSDYFVLSNDQGRLMVVRIPNGENISLSDISSVISNEFDLNKLKDYFDSLDNVVVEYFDERKMQTQLARSGHYNPNRSEKSFLKGSNYNNNQEQVPIFMLIELLSEKGYIDIISDLEKNGREVKYRFTISENNKDRLLSDNFIVSVVGAENYKDEPERSMYYVDFKGYFKREKGSAGDLNFLIDLERYGAFGKPEKLVNNPSDADVSDYNRRVYSKVGKILRELKKSIGSDIELVKRGSDFGISLSYPDMLPVKVQKNEKLKSIREFMNVLKIRGFSDEIIDDSLSKGLIYFGKTVNKKMGFQPINLIFGMFDVFGGKFPVSYESCYTIRNGNESPKKIGKVFGSIQRTGLSDANIITGSYFALSIDRSKSYKPNAVVFTEALLDSLAVKQLMDYAGKNHQDYTHISLQGVGNIVSFLKETLGFYYKKNDDEATNNYECGDVFSYDKKIEYIDFPDETKSRILEKLNTKKIKFIWDLSKKGSEYQYKKLRKFLDFVGYKEKIEKIEVKFRSEKIEDSLLVGDNVVLFDNTNVDKFLEQNKVISIDGQFKFIKITIDEVKVEDESRLLEYGERFKKAFGTDKVVLAFDNDTAGMSYLNGFYKMSKKIGISSSAAIPMFHVFDQPDGSSKFINDNNDILIFCNHLMESGKITKKDLKDWLEKVYFSQFDKINTFENGAVDRALDMASMIKELESNMGDNKDLLLKSIKELISKKKTGQAISQQSDRKP